MAEDKRLVCPLLAPTALAVCADSYCLGDKCALWDQGRLRRNGSDGQCAFLSIARLTGISYAE